MFKRWNTLLALLVIGSVMVTACGTGSVSSGDGRTPVIKIATQSPLSGGRSLLGVDIKRGAELALEQLGGSLKDMGFDVKLAPYDDEGSPDVGVTNAKKIVADSAILCGVGHLISDVMIPASAEYHAANLAFVSPATTNPIVTTRGYLEVNRIVGRDDVQVLVAEEYAFTELGASSVYIIHDKTAYGQAVAEFFRTAAEEDGLDVLAFEGTEETADFDAIITTLVTKKPDVVFFSGVHNRAHYQAGVFFKQAREAGYEGTFMGTDSMDESNLATLAGDTLTTGGGMLYISIAAPVRAYPKAAQFAADFQAKFGSAPQMFSAQAYDSMAVCLNAIEHAAKEAGGSVPTRLAVAKAIRALTHEGLTGSIGFDNSGDLPTAKYFVIKVNATSAETWSSNEIVAELDFASPGKGE
jgi:branched-chain amino acid transport system substrate-binding protein